MLGRLPPFPAGVLGTCLQEGEGQHSKCLLVLWAESSLSHVDLDWILLRYNMKLTAGAGHSEPIELNIKI